MRLATLHCRLWLLPVALVLGVSSRAIAAAAVLVLPVDGPGLLPSVRDSVEGAMRQELAGLPGHAVQRRQETATILADAGAGGLACSTADVACAARIGVIGEVDTVIVTALADVGKRMTVTVVEVATGSAVALAADRISLPAADAGASVRALVRRAVSPPALLDVEASPRGAIVFVDDVRLGGAPLPALVALEPGAHEVRVVVEGTPPRAQTRDVKLMAGERGAVLVRVPAAPVAAAPSPTPPSAPARRDETAPPPMVEEAGSGQLVTGAVVTAAGAVVALGAGVGVWAVENQLGTPRRGELQSDVDNVRALGVGLVVAAGIGVVLAAAGGVVMLLAPTEEAS